MRANSGFERCWVMSVIVFVEVKQADRFLWCDTCML